MDSERMLYQGDTRHGFVDEGAVPWDYYAIPERVWADLTKMPNGCWLAPSRKRATWYQMTIVDRITRRSSHDALAITPTCSDQRCCNPAHLCVTFATPLSLEGD